jgi:hypothetical protein
VGGTKCIAHLPNILAANDLAFLEKQSTHDPAQRKSGKRHAPIDPNDFIVAFAQLSTQSTYLVLHVHVVHSYVWVRLDHGLNQRFQGFGGSTTHVSDSRLISGSNGSNR